MAGAAPRISFVVPVYNMAPFIADCLNSILRQEGEHDYEVIVIDDASTDAGAEVIATFRRSSHSGTPAPGKQGCGLYRHRRALRCAGRLCGAY